MLFEKCCTDLNPVSVTNFWKKEFNILECMWLIIKAWRNLSKRTLIHGWKALCSTNPDWLLPGPQEENPQEGQEMVQGILEQANNMQMDVSPEDLENHFKVCFIHLQFFLQIYILLCDKKICLCLQHDFLSKNN